MIVNLPLLGEQKSVKLVWNWRKCLLPVVAVKDLAFSKNSCWIKARIQFTNLDTKRQSGRSRKRRSLWEISRNPELACASLRPSDPSLLVAAWSFSYIFPDHIALGIGCKSLQPPLGPFDGWCFGYWCSSLPPFFRTPEWSHERHGWGRTGRQTDLRWELLDPIAES